MSIPERGFVTKWLVGVLADQGLRAYAIVAPSKPPEAAGWDDDPSKPTSRFHEYAVVTPMDTPEPQSSIGDQHGEWLLPYALTYYGISHDQVEGQADKVRRIVGEVRKQVFTMTGGSRWSLMSCRLTGMGGVNPDRTPPVMEFNVRDTVVVRISKEL